MKKIYGFAALCAAMTLASCSNNDEPNVVSGAAGETVTAGYLSVNIANNNGTRADFVSGTEAESKASKATFVFFDGSNNFVSMVPDQDLTSTTAHADGDNIERDYNVMVPVSVTLPDNTAEADKASVTAALVGKIEKVVCILNPTSDINTAVNGKNVTGVLQVASNYATPAYTADNKFVMTNAVYVNEDGIVYAQDVTNKIKNSAIDATAEPVDLYVERVVARVDVKVNATGVNITDPTVPVLEYNDQNKLELNDKNLKIVINGVELANVANESYLVKNLDDAWKTTAPFTGWNDMTNLRSHWAQSWTINNATAPSRFSNVNQTTETSFANKAWQASGFSYVSGGTVPAPVNFYINENTNTAWVSEEHKESNATALVVSAQLCEEDADGNLVGKTLVRICRNGEYYAEDGAMNLLADMLKREGYYVKYGVDVVSNPDGTSTTKDLYRNLTPEDLVLKSDVELGLANAVGYEGYLTLKTGTTTTDSDGHKIIFTDADVYRTTDGGVTFNAVENFTANVLQSENYKVWKWNEGKCYYYVYLTNDTVENEETGDKYKGVVRNHIYEVTLNSMAGLGVPVFNPTDIIVPNTPTKITHEDEWNLACDIHILSWTRYRQNADFNQGTDY